MRPLKSHAIASLILTTAIVSFPVNATVITVDETGLVNINEAKNYRQKQKTDDAASETNSMGFEIFPDALQNDSDLTSLAPVIARPISAIEFSLDSETSTDLILEFEPSFLASYQKNVLQKPVVAPDTKREIANILTPQSETKLYAVFIEAEAEKYNKIDASLIESVIETESNYKSTAISPKGAMGLMQLMPATASRYNVINAFDPAENIRAGTAELARLFNLYDNPSLALAAYNAGEQAVDKYNGIPPYDETQNYVVKVLSKVFNKRQEILNLPPPLTQTTNTKQSQSDSLEPKKNNISKMKVYSFNWPE